MVVRYAFGLALLGCLVGVYIAFVRFSDQPVLLSVICTILGILATVIASLAFSNDEAMRRLAKVPDINLLVGKAETAEARLRNLEKAMKSLDKVILRESRRHFIASRIQVVEARMIELANEHAQLEEEAHRNDQDVVAEPEFESKVQDLLSYIRERERLRRDLRHFQTGTWYVDLLANALLKMVSR